MRISVLGNCQVCAIGGALRFLLPAAEVHAFWHAAASDEDTQRIRQTLIESDYVFSHNLSETAGILSTAALRQTMEQLVLIPGIYFTGFHPDSIWFSYNGKNVSSPVGMLHSAIIAAAYSLKFPADRVAKLFNAFTFRRLGYYDEFGKAQTFLSKVFKEHDFELMDVWDCWMAGDPFMLTPFHPRTDVLVSVAKYAARRVGILQANAETPVMPFDYLSHAAIFPVYPELAAALDMAGSYLFKRPGTQAQMRGDTLLLNLEEMIAESYELYSRYPADALNHAGVQRVASILSEVVR